MMAEERPSDALDNQAQPRRGMAGRKVAIIAGWIVFGICGMWIAVMVRDHFDVKRKVMHARTAVTRAQIANLTAALATFEADNGKYPTDAEGLGAMVRSPAGLPNWHQLLADVPVDGWGNDFAYQCLGTKNPGSFDLTSAGPDGKFGTKDDIER